MCILKRKMIVLNGISEERRGINACCVHHLQIPKNTLPAEARQGCSLCLACPAPAGEAPRKLFMVESVPILFIMKNEFAKVY
jgi:hypothetical protein